MCLKIGHAWIFMDVLMHVLWLCQALLQRTQMKHEKCSKRIQSIETLPLNPFKFEKHPLNTSIFNQRCTKIRCLQKFQPLMNFCFITILWKLLKTLGHDIFKGMWHLTSKNMERIFFGLFIIPFMASKHPHFAKLGIIKFSLNFLYEDDIQKQIRKNVNFNIISFKIFKT
jgi:hypothetical protein